MVRKVEGVRASAVLRERLQRVAAILAQPEAQAWRVSWDEADFTVRAKIIRPLGDAVREAIFGRPRTGTTEAVVGVADELREVLRVLGVHEIPRPVTHGAHARHPEFVGTDTGIAWLAECATWCARCRGAALHEIRVILGAAEVEEAETFNVDVLGACAILRVDPNRGGRQFLGRLRDRKENPLPARRRGRAYFYREADLLLEKREIDRQRQRDRRADRHREGLERELAPPPAILSSPRTRKDAQSR